MSLIQHIQIWQPILDIYLRHSVLRSSRAVASTAGVRAHMRNALRPFHHRPSYGAACARPCCTCIDLHALTPPEPSHLRARTTLPSAASAPPASEYRQGARVAAVQYRHRPRSCPRRRSPPLALPRPESLRSEPRPGCAPLPCRTLRSGDVSTGGHTRSAGLPAELRRGR